MGKKNRKSPEQREKQLIKQAERGHIAKIPLAKLASIESLLETWIRKFPNP